MGVVFGKMLPWKATLLLCMMREVGGKLCLILPCHMSKRADHIGFGS
jgi:hypothetical protein